MSVVVNQTYTASLNVSVTTRNGEPTRVVLWKSNVKDSTQVVVNVPQVRFSNR